MPRLTICSDANPGQPVWDSVDPSLISAKLGAAGVRFETWTASAEIARDAGDAAVLSAYAGDIDRLQREGGYRSVDVLRVLPDHPQLAELRRKFLQEHIHAEDEVRFFVEGSGMFYLHIEKHVYMTLCTRGTLIAVPRHVRHWFDLGSSPCITAIRLFTTAEGWVAQYTGSDIAEQFPKFEREAA